MTNTRATKIGNVIGVVAFFGLIFLASMGSGYLKDQERQQRHQGDATASISTRATATEDGTVQVPCGQIERDTGATGWVCGIFTEPMPYCLKEDSPPPYGELGCYHLPEDGCGWAFISLGEDTEPYWLRWVDPKTANPVTGDCPL